VCSAAFWPPDRLPCPPARCTPASSASAWAQWPELTCSQLPEVNPRSTRNGLPGLVEERTQTRTTCWRASGDRRSRRGTPQTASAGICSVSRQGCALAVARHVRRFSQQGTAGRCSSRPTLRAPLGGGSAQWRAERAKGRCSCAPAAGEAAGGEARRGNLMATHRRWTAGEPPRILGGSLRRESARALPGVSSILRLAEAAMDARKVTATFRR